jgi:hypothetical protein
MEGGSDQSASLAEFYHGVSHQFPDESEGHDQRWLAERRDFLRRFFSKEPELKRSFESWIADLKRTATAVT